MFMCFTVRFINLFVDVVTHFGEDELLEYNLVHDCDEEQVENDCEYEFSNNVGWVCGYVPDFLPEAFCVLMCFCEDCE